MRMNQQSFKALIQQRVKALMGVLAVALLLSSGCAEDKESAGNVASTDRPVVKPLSMPTQAVTRLPVSLNTVMVAMINQAADPLWVAAWRNPQNDKEWRELERRAVQLELGGTLLGVPGTGPMDDQWASNADWRSWAKQLRDVGAAAVVAVKARNVDSISAVGDDVVAICEGCHSQFKPALPTGGEFGELSPTPADLQE